VSRYAGFHTGHQTKQWSSGPHPTGFAGLFRIIETTGLKQIPGFFIFVDPVTDKRYGIKLEEIIIQPGSWQNF
jgi:hypothetical protein